MSVAIIPMGIDLSYTEEVRGAISSVFSFGYLFGMIPAGLLGSFVSPKYVLGTGVLLWSIAQTLSPAAAYYSLPALYLTRFFMGASEAVTVPTVQNFVARFVPEERKSVVLGIVLSGLQVGNVGAFLISPFLLDNFGWTGVLVSYGVMGLFWLALWVPFAKDDPNESTNTDVKVGALECDLLNQLQIRSNKVLSIQSARKAAMLESRNNNNALSISKPAAETLSDKFNSLFASMSNVPFLRIVSLKPVQAIAVAHAVQNFGLYINLAWLPTYFNQKYGLSVDDSSLSSVLPWVAGAVVGPLTGFLADHLISSGIDKTFVRKAAQTFSLIVPAIALLTLSMAPADLTREGAISLFVLAVASAAVYVAGFGSSVQDVCASSKYVSVVYSLTSAPAVLLGSSGVYLTGVLLDKTQSFSLAFQGVSVVYLLGATFFALNYDAKKIIE